MSAMFDGLEDIDIAALVKDLREQAQARKKENEKTGTKDARDKGAEDFKYQHLKIVHELRHYHPYIIEKWLRFDNWNFYQGFHQ